MTLLSLRPGAKGRGSDGSGKGEGGWGGCYLWTVNIFMSLNKGAKAKSDVDKVVGRCWCRWFTGGQPIPGELTIHN